MAHSDRPTFVVLVIALVVCAMLWGFVERRVQAFRRGFHIESLGWERTGRLLTIGQGMVTIIMLALVGVAFWLFGWKIGVGALLFSFVVGVLAP